MNNNNSTTLNSSSNKGYTHQGAAVAKGTTTPARVNIKMIQNVFLIWLDSNINENDADCRNSIVQLQRVVKNINTFINGDECIKFIETIDRKSKACMIISGSLGQHMVPRVHGMSQVDSIFIFCGNQKYHEQWAKEWPKIKGVFTKITPICEALGVAAQQCEQNAIPISFMATSADASQRKLDQLDCSFMYTQILKNILLTIHFEQQHIQEFTDYCHALFIDDDAKLKYVQELERNYHKKTSIRWYTCQSFLYPMLNTSLRLLDVDIVIKMGVFIQHLHRQIEELHEEQFDDHSATFTVFRGQGMFKEDFQQLTQTKGGLMAFNSFLSTSKDRNVSLGFAHDALPNPHSVGILFVMTIDPSKSTTPFASVNGVSCFKEQEDEVLFSMHTVFRIHDIKPLGEKDRLYQVDLTLTGDNDKDLRLLSNRIEDEMKEYTGWYRLGELLLKLDEPARAEVVYQILLGQTTEEIDRALIYFRLGRVKADQGEYTEALKFYEKSLKMRQEILAPNHPDLAKSYNNIGNVYASMGDYSKALSSYEKALAIRQQSLPPNDPDLASSYNNIGIVYRNMGDYSKALSSYKKALAVRQQSLPPNHPDLGTSYNNIGVMYNNLGDYSKALSFYKRAVDIGEKSLPSNHSELQKWRNNLDRVKKKL